MSEQYRWIGKRLPRKDALEKVTGMAKMVSDLQFPRMLHARFLRSPHAHARIVRIDASRAEALPGVKSVLTYQNTPKVRAGARKFDCLFNGVVCYAGAEVAMVAAESKEIADAALKLIEVEYEPLPAVFDAEEAMQAGAPLVHPEYGTNIYHGTEFNPVPRCSPDGWLRTDWGDVEKGFAEADYILEGSYASPMQCNASPMPRSVICQWSGHKLTCWADSQIPMFCTKDLARCFGLPISGVRVISQYPVGGYGAKNPDKVAVLCAIVAKKTGRPVKAFYSRAEEFVNTHHRPDYKAYERIGVKKDGTISALHHRMIGNCGADHGWCLEVLSASAAATGSSLYPAPNVKFEGCMVMTNLPHISPMIGMGDPEAGFCVERLIDEAAEAVGMDPVEFRLKNCARHGTRSVTRRDVMGLRHDELEHFPGELRWGVLGSDFDGLPEGIKAAAEAAHWKEKWRGWGTPVAVNGTKRRGIGIGIGMHMSEYRLYSAICKMNQDGSASILSSAVEIGQGIETAMSQVVAEALGIDYADVNILFGDTIATPEGWGIIASGGTSSAIPAAYHAALDARRKILEFAAGRMGVSPENLDIKDRTIFVKEQPEKSIPIKDACLRAYQITGEAVNPDPDGIIEPQSGKAIKSYTWAATVAEVEVDAETGDMELLGLYSSHGAGRAINMTTLENQMDVGLVIGNGLARSEDYVIDRKTGVVLNPNFLDYKPMTAMDMPRLENYQKILIETPSAWGAYGSKGFSESAGTTSAPALANAIYNATGVRVRGDHLTPERILEAMRVPETTRR